MFLSQAHLIKKFDLSESTTKRICSYIREKGQYKKDYIFLGGCKRYNVDSFEKFANERRGAC